MADDTNVSVDEIDIAVGSGPGAVDSVDINTEVVSLAHSVTLKWNPAPAGQTVQSYNVKRSLAQASGYATIGTVVGSTQTFVDSDPTLKEGTTYFYEVTAVNTGGESAASNIATVSIPFSLPSAPTGLVVAAVA